eukprot:4472715-Amphidinium_carterae.1
MKAAIDAVNFNNEEDRNSQTEDPASHPHKHKHNLAQLTGLVTGRKRLKLTWACTRCKKAAPRLVVLGDFFLPSA